MGHRQAEISEQRPFGLPWLDSCYQETLLPEAPWHQVRELLCDNLAEKMKKHMDNEKRRQMMFELVGPRFTSKYFADYENDPQILEPPQTSPEDRHKVAVDTTNWMQVAMHQVASDVRCQRPEVIQDEEEDVAGEMEDFLHHTKSVVAKNMERHLFLQEEILVKKRKTKLEAMDALREDKETWARWQAAERKRQETSHIKGILKNPQPVPGSAMATPGNVPYRPPPTPQIKAEMYIPGAQPPLWGYQAESLGRALVYVLKRDPRRFAEIAWRLHGRQLPSALRTYIWLDVLLMTNRDSHKGTELNVEKVVRERFGRMVSRGMEEMRITRATHSPISSLIDKSVIEVYDVTPGMKAYQADDNHMKDATKALNVLHCFDRSYEPYLIYWLFPLQLAFREQAGQRETAYELALYLYLLRHACFPRWPEVFSLAESVLESLRSMDEELLLHLKEIAVVNPNLDTKNFMVELLHIERSKAEQLKKNQKPGPKKGPAESAALFDDPLIYLRKWIGEGFVSVLDTPAVVWLWDQLFMEKWDRKIIIDACLSLLLLLKHGFMEATDHASMAEVFQSEPCKLYTKDIQRAWMHLQYGGQPYEVPPFNRRRPNEDRIWSLYLSTQNSSLPHRPSLNKPVPVPVPVAPPPVPPQPNHTSRPTLETPAGAPLDPVGIKGIVVYVVFSKETTQKLRWVAGLDPEDVKLLCTVYFGGSPLGTQVSVKAASCPLGARQLDDGSTAYMIYFPKTVLEFRGLDPSTLDVEQELGAQPHAVLQADYYGHDDTKAGRALPITLGWARLPLYVVQSDAVEAGLKLWVIRAREGEEVALTQGPVPEVMPTNPADVLPPPADQVYIEASSTLKGSVFDLRRDAPSSPTPTELGRKFPDKASSPAKKSAPTSESYRERTLDKQPTKPETPRKQSLDLNRAALPQRPKNATRTITDKIPTKEPAESIRPAEREPTPPPPAGTPDVNSTFDMYIDGVENIPDSATVIKVTGRLVKTGALSGIPDVMALPEVKSSARSPRFRFRQIINKDKTAADKDMLGLLRVYTIDKNSKDPKTLCVIGSCLFGFYDSNGYVRVGGHRCLLRTGMPDLSKGVSVLNPLGMEGLPRIPGCAIRVRLQENTSKLEEAPDDPNFYKVDNDTLTDADTRVAASYEADPKDPEVYPQNVNEMVAKLRELEGDSSTEVSKLWIRDRLNQKKHLEPNQPAGNLPLPLLVEYRMPVGINVQITQAYGLPAGRYIHSFARVVAGSTAKYRAPTMEGYGRKDYFYTSRHDYDARQSAPVWQDEKTTIHPHPDWCNVLVVQVIGLRAVYHPTADHNSPGHVTTKAGQPVTLDDEALIGWAVVPLMKRWSVWSGKWRVPILSKPPDDDFLNKLSKNAVEEVFQQHQWAPADILDGASLDVKVWDAHFQPEELPQGFKDQDLLLEILGTKERCSLVRQETKGKQLYQMILSALGKKYQKLGTKSFIYDREKEFFTQVMEETFTSVMNEAKEQADQRYQTPPPDEDEGQGQE